MKTKAKVVFSPVHNKRPTEVRLHRLLSKFIYSMYFADNMLKYRSIAEAPDRYIHTPSRVTHQSLL